jgi:EAL domain-containing protein (putative c-di-GMP-specific phosphodiesterase class I)/GGDEF domain-containing protein
MSLRKQLWIAVAILLLLALMVSIVVSTLSARNYLVQQLHTKNIDNAASLALSLSQLPKDDTTVELQVAAQFDTGHYRRIRLVAPNGEVMQERHNPAPPQGVPDWFVSMAAFDIRPGVAHISDGWRSFGTLYVESQTTYAYESLWGGTLRLVAIFAAGLLLIGLLGSFLLGRLVRPLNDVVEQARAIGARRFVTIREPRTLEFRTLVRAMNRLSEHVRLMLMEESARLEILENRLLHDPVTGLLRREPYLARLQAALDSRHARTAGILVVLRVQDLAALNGQLGHAGADTLLKRIAEVLDHEAATTDYGAAGRLNGSDLTLFAENVTDPQLYADSVLAAVRGALGGQAPEDLRLAVGATPFEAEDGIGQILARVDNALARAEMDGGDRAEHEPYAAHPYAGQEAWREAITRALDERGVILGSFPVVDAGGNLLHTEAPMRLTLEGEQCAAGYFMPWAERLDLIQRLDQAVLEAAMARIRREQQPLAINLSVRTLCDTGFRHRLETELGRTPGVAGHLWLEFPARSALQHPGELRDICRIAQGTGCRIGLEHAGPEIFRQYDLSSLGVNYVKLNAALIAATHGSAEAQALVRGLCTLAHSIGILVIAEGCDTPQDLERLPELGLDAMTGRAVQPSDA